MIFQHFKKCSFRFLSVAFSVALIFTSFSGNASIPRKTVNAETRISKEAPYLSTISDAIKPGETVTITGNFLDANDLRIAYAPNSSDNQSFNESDLPEGCRFIENENITVKDEQFASGLMFILPKNIEAGRYDFWVKNAVGWSEKITLNEVRPLYLLQEAAYAGLNVEIVGRNFSQVEYGAATEENAFSHLSVKLDRVRDLEGNADSTDYSYVLTENNGGILTGVKCSSSEALLGDDIAFSNPYKITLSIPTLTYTGTYTVSVATNGKDFQTLSEPQELCIYDKKAENWNAEVFGNANAGIGNDPLNLGVYWAQDLKYNNVKTMTPNADAKIEMVYKTYVDSDGETKYVYEKNDKGEIQKKVIGYTSPSVDSLTSSVNSAISSLSSQGGGVVYFPAGKYYVKNITMKDNVILVGAGMDETYLYHVGGGGGTFISGYYYNGGRSLGRNNIGLARMTIANEANSAYPDNFIGFLEGMQHPEFGKDSTTRTSYNKFLVDIKVEADKQYSNKRVFYECLEDGSDYIATGATGAIRVSATANAAIMEGGKNGVIKRVEGVNTGNYTCNFQEYNTVYGLKMDYSSVGSSPAFQGKYTSLENCYFDFNGGGHGPSLRSDSYVAHSYVSETGNRERYTNDGETLLFEPAGGGYHAIGEIISASKDSFDCAFTYGTPISKESNVPYNQIAIYISEGKGVGQVRYFEKSPTFADGDSNLYSYNLCENEKNWDVIPDTTSRFTIYCPLKNITVYRFEANDAVSSLCLYSQVIDAVIADCTLKDTGGIVLNSVSNANQGRLCTNKDVRIVNNDISGVGAVYNLGYESGQGVGGIKIYCERVYDVCKDAHIIGVNIKGNRLTDIQPDVPHQSMATKPVTKSFQYNGIVVYTNNKITEDTEYKGDLRFVTIEGNTVNNSQKGVYAENRITGLVIRNNDFGLLTNATKGVETYNADQEYILTTYTFINDGNEDALSGDYLYGSTLPTLEDSEKGLFEGWFLTDSPTGTDMPVTKVESYKALTLYAKFTKNAVVSNVTYVADGATHSNPAIYTEGTALTLTAATKEGYTFEGWYDNADFNGTALTEIATTQTGDVTLYAKFVEIDDGSNDSGNTGSSDNSSDTGNTGSSDTQTPGTSSKSEGGSGCGSTLSNGAIIILIVFLAFSSVLKIKKRKGEKR